MIRGTVITVFFTTRDHRNRFDNLVGYGFIVHRLPIGSGSSDGFSPTHRAFDCSESDFW